MPNNTDAMIEEKALKSYKIEYEIPPLRAIYLVIADHCTDEGEAEQALKAEHPGAKIRKIQEVDPNDYPTE